MLQHHLASTRATVRFVTPLLPMQCVLYIHFTNASNRNHPSSNNPSVCESMFSQNVLWFLHHSAAFQLLLPGGGIVAILGTSMRQMGPQEHLPGIHSHVCCKHVSPSSVSSVTVKYGSVLPGHSALPTSFTGKPSVAQCFATSCLQTRTHTKHSVQQAAAISISCCPCCVSSQ